MTKHYFSFLFTIILTAMAHSIEAHGLKGFGLIQREKGSSTGASNGGFEKGGLLFDFHYARERKKKSIENVRTLRGFEENVSPLIEKLYSVHSLFAADLEKFLDEKSWFYVGVFDENVEQRFIQYHKKTQKTAHKVKLNRVGFQDAHEIELLEGWHKTAPIQDAGGLIIHELVVGQMQELFPEKEDDEIQRISEELTAVLMLDKTLSTEKLLKRLQTDYKITRYSNDNAITLSGRRKFDQCKIRIYFKKTIIHAIVLGGFKAGNAGPPFPSYRREMRFSILGLNGQKAYTLKKMPRSLRESRLCKAKRGIFGGIKGYVANKLFHQEVNSILDYLDFLKQRQICPNIAKTLNFYYLDENAIERSISSKDLYSKICNMPDRVYGIK